MVRKAMIAALFVSASAGFAFAQSSPSPANQAGPGVSPTAPSPTDQSAGSESGNTVGVPERGTTIVPRTTGEGAVINRETMTDRENTSVPGKGVEKDDTVPRR